MILCLSDFPSERELLELVFLEFSSDHITEETGEPVFCE